MFEKIDRVVVGVRDLEKSKEYFSELLGIKFDQVLVSERLKMQAVYSSFGLELVAATEPDSVVDKFVQTRGEGVFAIVVKVADLDQAVKMCREKGLRYAGDLEVGGLREVAFHPRDAHGVQIVLTAYDACHPATIAALKK